jgi:hypothetical protein
MKKDCVIDICGLAIGPEILPKWIKNAIQRALLEQLLIHCGAATELLSMGNCNNQLLDIIANPPIPTPEAKLRFYRKKTKPHFASKQLIAPHGDAILLKQPPARRTQCRVKLSHHQSQGTERPGVHGTAAC